VLLLAVALVLLLPRQRRLARHDIREVTALSSSLPPATAATTPPAEQASTPVIAGKLSPAPITSEPKPPPPQEKQDAAPKEGKTRPPARQEKPAEVKPPEPASTLKIVVKRRVERTEEQLVEQIKEAPAVALDTTSSRVESNAVIATALKMLSTGNADNDATLALIDLRADLAGLPLRRGKACHLPRNAAAHFDECARSLRGQVASANQLRKILTGGENEKKWLKKETVPVLMQMVMAEAFAVREVLVEHLSSISGREATDALVRLALFDLHQQVRARAINALTDRPVKEYRQALLRGFEHPWPAVADHAAEAVAALKMKDSVRTLAILLDKPDPTVPYGKPNSNRRFVKELVRVNHLGNCLLCHAPSFRAQDKVRGLVPPANQPLSPAYYAPAKGIFVRADVTYLKQDFSRMLPVAKPGKWPAVQRFDFFVRERFATQRDERVSHARRQAGPREQQQALFFALRELTGHDPGSTVADWKAFVFAHGLEQ
jgi:hypothetical protein